MKHLAILVLLSLCQIIGLLLFLKGFLLTRIVVPEHSHNCHDDITGEGTAPISNINHCNKPMFRKVVWILIDALRYDFTVYEEGLNPSPPSFRNKMPNVDKVLKEKPRNAKLFRFIADPPTTTMQRLKALTTGSLPTFIDIGSNFNSYEITEDNLIYQCKSNGGKITFMGDDTWLGLYPNLLDKAYPFPSLNVKDLHTVDNGVIEHLFYELATVDTQLLIAHLLGVDHCGHTYGPSHIYMGQKLRQMDDMLKKVFDSLDNESIVFIFGDHGMTSTGDHGGETTLETDAALLVYSSRPIFNPKQIQGENVFQTDIVPTVSLLLGVPIPFSNLGMIITDIFVPHELNPTPKLSRTLHSNLTYPRSVYYDRVTFELLSALKRNADQLYQYMRTQIKYGGDFSSSAVSILEEKYKSANIKFNEVRILEEVKDLDDFQRSQLTSTADITIDFMSNLRSVCVEMWAKFDDVYISSGILVLILCLLAVSIVLFIVEDTETRIKTNRESFQNLIQTLMYCILDTEWINILSMILVLLHSVALFSNSFVVYEQNLIVFFQQTLVISLAAVKLKQAFNSANFTPWKWKTRKEAFDELTKNPTLEIISWKSVVMLCVNTLWPYIGMMVCIRSSALFHSCRDQQDDCTPLHIFKSLKLLEPNEVSYVFVISRFMLLLLFFFGTVKATDHFFQSKFSCHERYKDICSSACSFFTGQLVFAALPMAVFEVASYNFALLSIWCVYIVSITSIFILIWKPWFGSGHYFSDLNWKCTLAKEDPKFFGSSESEILDTVHCLAPVSWLVMSILSPIMLVVVVPNDVYLFSFTLFLLQLMLLITVLQNSPEVPLFTRAVLCSFFGYQYFFGIGHQATVTSLRFEAGFVGLSGEMTSITLPIAGILVGLNTLASQILASVYLPLMLPYKKSKFQSKDQNPVISSLFKLQLFYIGIGSLRLLCAVIAASVHRRHLMIWAVFGPRFMYEAAFQCVSSVLTVCMYLLVCKNKYSFDNGMQKAARKLF